MINDKEINSQDTKFLFLFIHRSKKKEEKILNVKFLRPTVYFVCKVFVVLIFNMFALIKHYMSLF